MQVQLLAFAHLAERLGFHQKPVETTPEETPRDLLRRVAAGLDLSSIRVAVDEEYHSWDEPIGSAREIALIPPVSGG